MEQTTLQQRIEERARRKLLKDLYDAANKEREIAFLIDGCDTPMGMWDKKLNVTERYDTYNHKTGIRINNDYSQIVFDALLPKYIQLVTDEILHKIDEIDYLLQEKGQEEYQN